VPGEMGWDVAPITLVTSQMPGLSCPCVTPIKSLKVGTDGTMVGVPNASLGWPVPMYFTQIDHSIIRSPERDSLMHTKSHRRFSSTFAKSPTQDSRAEETIDRQEVMLPLPCQHRFPAAYLSTGNVLQAHLVCENYLGSYHRIGSRL
jgi:hypothetical protein